MSLTRREPVHVLYGGAHLFRSNTPQKLGRIALNALETYAPTPNELANSLGINGSDELIREVFERARRKLETEPVEDFRIDFEDGYGVRSNDEEDTHAKTSAVELARAFAEQFNTAFTGVRIKAFSDATRQRAERTLRIFLVQLFESNEGRIPERFTITLPKVTSVDEVAGLDTELTKFENENDIASGSIEIELMIETPKAIYDHDGRVMLPRLIEAANGRCSSAHFGAYDYTSALGISAGYHSLRHPACELAKSIMLTTLAPLGVRLVDSVTTEIPAPPNRGSDLSEDQTRVNCETVHRAWKTHFDNVLYSMSNGFYQSWDLHPNQLVARFAAVNYFYLDGFEEQAKRLKNYSENAAQATLTGTAFDDAASARGVVNFFLRGLNCGALTENEIEAATGLNHQRLKSVF
jgi:citrate lyase beta subunit